MQSFNMQDTFKGLFMSFTAWFSALLIAWPDIAAQVGELLTGLVGGEKSDWAMRFVGLVVLLLRVKTNNSLADKVAK